MQIDDKLFTYLEDLSCLTLSADDKSRLAKNLPPILDCMAKLGELDTNGVPECYTPLDNFNVFRNDEVRSSFNRELILKNAPVRNDEFIIAPKTVE
ncbi:MAG: Asp-tRNA(Asn)/Glu-tRNA(Gln) amidotransferase subunit GatC [Treponema sp.]|jgi:aspartyl-tRNA(Asn)/glutamyl-tRNA(Gln) amidotransferase subunit C|nr:Asp-tRNA(Asn)/Glu-tRNA(Gln) amidotransferase subunit GatC [Treponema sp.]